MWKWYSDVEWTGEWNHTCLWKNEHERRGSRDFGTEMTLFLFCFKKYFQGPFAVETRLVTYQSIALESLHQRSFQSNSIRSRVWPQIRENLEKKWRRNSAKFNFRQLAAQRSDFFSDLQVDMLQPIKCYRTVQVFGHHATGNVVSLLVANCEFPI